MTYLATGKQYETQSMQGIVEFNSCIVHESAHTALSYENLIQEAAA